MTYHAELLPCPFCGGRAAAGRTYNFETTLFKVQCMSCPAAMKGYDQSEADAIDGWNTRTPAPQCEVRSASAPFCTCPCSCDETPHDGSECALHPRTVTDWEDVEQLTNVRPAALGLTPLQRIDLLCEQEALYTREELVSLIRKITALASRPAGANLPTHCDNCHQPFQPDDDVFASVNHGIRRTVHLKCPAGATEREVVAWQARDGRYPYVSGIVTTRPETVEAWREGNIKFVELCAALPEPGRPASGAEGSANRPSVTDHPDCPCKPAKCIYPGCTCAIPSAQCECPVGMHSIGCKNR